MPGRRAARVICHPFFSLSLSLYFICLPFLLLIFFSFTFFFFFEELLNEFDSGHPFTEQTPMDMKGGQIFFLFIFHSPTFVQQFPFGFGGILVQTQDERIENL